jgi:putative DNA primase/helicase
VALSAILTACVRRCLGNAPLHAYSAPVAGTGKGKPADVACVISTGFEASPLNQGGDEEETEKRISAKLMTGEAFIAIDNCSRPLGGDLICSMLTQRTVSPRILGKSKTPSLSAGAFVTAGGNGLIIKGDFTRRTVIWTIDAGLERPEKRTFAFDPVREAMEQRPRLVVAALTILRAYDVAGRPERPKPLGSFEAWSDLVRSALIWLGRADPVASMDELRKADPVLEALRAIMCQWVETIGTILQVTTADLIKTADERAIWPAAGSVDRRLS